MQVESANISLFSSKSLCKLEEDFRQVQRWMHHGMRDSFVNIVSSEYWWDSDGTVVWNAAIAKLAFNGNFLLSKQKFTC